MAKTPNKTFSGPVLTSLRDDAFLYIRAGEAHKFVGIWAVDFSFGAILLALFPQVSTLR